MMKIDGKKVRIMRKDAGFPTQAALAKAAGLSTRTIYVVESTDYHYGPHPRTVLSIASALGCDPEDIALRNERQPEHSEHPKAKHGGITATVPRYATDEELVKVAHAFRGTGVPVYFE